MHLGILTREQGSSFLAEMFELIRNTQVEHHSSKHAAEKVGKDHPSNVTKLPEMLHED